MVGNVCGEFERLVRKDDVAFVNLSVVSICV